MSTQHAPITHGVALWRRAFATFGASAACLASVAAQPGQHALPPVAPVAPSALEPVVLFAGNPGGVGSLAVYDALTGGPLLSLGRLQDLQLLALDHSGRTQQEELYPERPRLRADLPGGVTRLVLPFGAGSLYRYVRGVGGVQHYGFLVVRAGALPRVALELQGHGPAFADPFVATVGVAPDGRSFLVATSVAAGGDLYEVPLVEGSLPALRTSAVAPQAFSPDGLWLGRDFGFGIAPTGAWRFPRVAGGTATAVPVPQGTTWTGQAVMNRARRHALASTGSDPLQRDTWVFGPTGVAVRASRAPAEIADAGFAPQHGGGPWMALSDDGTLAAWAETTVVVTVPPTVPPTVVRDVRLQRVASPTAGPVVTGDDYLLDTLDEIGRMSFYRPTELTYAAGEVNDPAEQGLAATDFFGASLGPNDQPILRNLSVTSGDPSVPFTAGIPTLTPATVHALGGERLLIHDDDAEELQLLDTGAGGLTVLELDVKDLYWFEPVGNWYCAAVRRRNGLRPIEVLRFPRDFSSGPVTLDPGSPDHEFLFPVVRGATITWIESILLSQRLERANVDLLQVETWSPTAGVFAPPLGLGAAGDVRFARVAAGLGVESRVWRVGAPDIVMMHPVRPGHWLP
jgi:hypothetical protein